MIKQWSAPSRRRGQGGQALVETALVIMIFVILVIGFVGEGLQVAARVQVQEAARLATVSALQAPLGDRGDALKYAENTFFATMSNEPFVTAEMGGCTYKTYFAGSCTPVNACSGDYLSGIRHTETSGFSLTCSVTDIAVLYYKVGPLSMLWPATVTIANISATVFPSSYRTCAEGVQCTSGP